MKINMASNTVDPKRTKTIQKLFEALIETYVTSELKSNQAI